MNINLAFDIGYNLGDFSKRLLEKYPTACIVGVEANGSILPNAYTHENIAIVNAAVSDKSNDYIDFYTSPIHTISTASKKWMEGRFKGLQWDIPTSVITITIDDLIKNYGEPDVIKIDIEGYEFTALQGLTKKSGMLMFEWTEEAFHSETLRCVEYLKSIGYTKFCYTDSKTENGGFVDLKFNVWETLDIHDKIEPSRKAEWGMIYAI
jgi:FkbM family methyltransferase